MTDAGEADLGAADAGFATTAAHSERDVAQGVTRWLIANFRSELADATRSTPFTVPLLCAIACREAGMYWLPLTPHRGGAEILGLCVYDASGDVAGAPRTAFPINTAQFRLTYGDAFTQLLIAETNKARAARGLSPASMIYKGYGIFQYDLQHVRTDEAFFRQKKWYVFEECVSRVVSELTSKYEATGNIQEAVRAYNGSGQKARQYAQDVMRLLPYCEEAAGSPQIASLASASLSSAARDGGAVLGAMDPQDASDDDPGAPAPTDVTEVADEDTARLLANLGYSVDAESAAPAEPGVAAVGDTAFDLARARAFLDACRTARPRVTYGLGQKVPFLDAVPGRDFTQVDCSGFVRQVVRLATTPSLRFPDGSVNQHQWARARGLETSSVAEGRATDDVVRIAFLRPQDAGRKRIGHVVLIANGETLESHGGVGPDSRPWTGTGWQAKAFVYVLARDARIRAAASAERLAAARTESVAKPSIVRTLESATMRRTTASIFTTQALPQHHDDILVVTMRPGPAEAPAAAGMAMGMGMAPAPETPGLGALSYFARAGRIKRVVPLRASEEAVTAPSPMAAAAAMMGFHRPAGAPDVGAPVRFIEMMDGQDAKQLHGALASDPSVLSVSQVPVRYLAARRAGRTAAGGGLGIAAAPPAASLLWNLAKIRWQEARAAAGFQEATRVRVAVLDTGVDAKHPSLRVSNYYWQNADLTRPVSELDLIGHGTHVSGTIAALIASGVSVQGVCACQLDVWKIFDDEPTYAPGQGAFVYYVNPILYRRALAACVDDPPHVVNLSIGGPAVPDPTERTLFEQLLASGVTICAAMGNDRQYGSPTSYPAAIPGVVAVGATGLDDRVTLFSNSGNHIAVAAPGKAIWSTLPRYDGQTAFGIAYGPDGRPQPGARVRRECNYDAWDGTSMATPHVTGSAALLIAKSIAAGGELKPDQVRAALMTSADKVQAMNGADFSADYGAGRINLLKLLQ
ncbi:peptidase S8 and S53 subtilisin kexin sedolisin [Methylobacterium sp. 4-46]|uniref:S8 family serine peptidase n=1 Tax=unclassified Methylobacterium TaxID=2615210 RepID=UPI000152C3F5|nr:MULTISPECIES: S8 family serine peptidase [Methylobacterium]ACA15295.1 peptidase S8 and S53 subtilisin kexin sedolisin [Methylobacterium sp. 4-46]WFT81020.1 S8 family serine peptidase [Methylobacterium nodulans]